MAGSLAGWLAGWAGCTISALKSNPESQKTSKMSQKGNKNTQKKQIRQKITKTGLEQIQKITRVQSTRAKVLALKSQTKKMAGVSPKARSTGKTKGGRVQNDPKTEIFASTTTPEEPKISASMIR